MLLTKGDLSHPLNTASDSETLAVTDQLKEYIRLQASAQGYLLTHPRLVEFMAGIETLDWVRANEQVRHRG